LDAEQGAAELNGDVQVLGNMTSEASDLLNALQTHLLSVSDEVAQLYHHICTVNGETPSLVRLNHEKSGQYHVKPLIEL